MACVVFISFSDYYREPNPVEGAPEGVIASVGSGVGVEVALCADTVESTVTLATSAKINAAIVLTI